MSGLVLLGMSIFMIIGNYLGGYLFDNASPYKTSIIFMTISTISVIALIFFHGWPTFAFLLMPFDLGNGANLTLTNSYATAIVEKSSRYIFNIMYIGLNLGIVIGSAMAGFLLKGGVAFLFTVTSVFYVAALLMTILQFNVDLSKYQRVSGAQPKHQVIHYGNHHGLLISICLMVFCIYMTYAIWDSVMSVHMTSLGISFIDYSWVWVINGILIVLGQDYVNRLFGRLKISVQVAIGVAIFAVSYFGLIPARHYLAFVISMIVLTIGEMISLPDIPAWIDNFARLNEKGRYQAYFNVSMTAGRAVGPLFDGIVVESISYGFLFGFSGILVLLSLLLVMIEVIRTYRRRQHLAKAREWFRWIELKFGRCIWSRIAFRSALRTWSVRRPLFIMVLILRPVYKLNFIS